MIQMLQKKFIMTAMAAISVLILVLLGALNAMNFWITSQQIDHTLSMLASGPEETPPPDRGSGFFEPPMDRDVLLSARYFLVFFDSSGQVVGTDVTRIASVSEEQAEEYGQQVQQKQREKGSLDRFRYQVSSGPEGGQVIAFLDWSSQLYAAMAVLGLSVLAGVVCWGMMLLLVILLSKRAILPIARNMENQKQFVTNAGHEIKTPLAIILANTDAMELHQGESRWSRNIREQTVRLSGLMQNLLTLSKTEEEAGRLPVSDFSFSDLMEEILQPYYEAAALKGIRIEADIQPEISFCANRESMAQLLSILFDNGVKYADDGGILQVTLKKPDKRLLIQVKNSCETLPNVPPERLFERFYRGDSARTQKDGGYGIGLSVAKAVAESVHGSITASYEGENQMVFTVRL